MLIIKNDTVKSERKGSWVEAKDLHRGNSLLNSRGNPASVVSVEPLPSPDITVYNFEVEGTHNYFVGEQGVLVHNYDRNEFPTDLAKYGLRAALSRYFEAEGNAKTGKGLYTNLELKGKENEEQQKKKEQEMKEWNDGDIIPSIANGVKTDRFMKRFNDKTKKWEDSFHSGLDISAPKGTIIPLGKEGKIVFIQRDQTKTKTFFGNQIVIEHLDGLFLTEYSHLDRISNDIKEGIVLKKGIPIGTVGDNGSSSGGNHLHFVVKKKNSITGGYDLVNPESTDWKLKRTK